MFIHTINIELMTSILYISISIRWATSLRRDLMQIFVHRPVWQTIVFISLLSIAFMLLGSSGVNAQAVDEQPNSETQQTQVEPSFVPETYNYTVQECNNYTLLIRNSVQLYDQANDSVELSQAQVIYAETNIAQAVEAADIIFPNEEIKIDSELVAKYAASSQDLSSGQISAWQSYVANARFNLEEISANNVALNDNGTVVQVDEDSGEIVDSTPLEDSQESTDDPNDDEESTAVGWWVAGGLVITSLWYLLWQRGGEEE